MNFVFRHEELTKPVWFSTPDGQKTQKRPELHGQDIAKIKNRNGSSVAEKGIFFCFVWHFTF